MLRYGKSALFFLGSLYDTTVIKISSDQGGIIMKALKKWLFALTSALMVLGAAAACSNTSTETDDTKTEQTDDGSQTDDNSSESGQ